MPSGERVGLSAVELQTAPRGYVFDQRANYGLGNCGLWSGETYGVPNVSLISEFGILNKVK